MKIYKFIFILIILFSQKSFAQNKTDYIKKGVFTQIVSITDVCNHADTFVSFNVFRGELDKVTWGNAVYIISYRYLGIDSQNNLHVLRIENNYSLQKEDRCELIFKLDINRPTEITLLSQNSLKIPFSIKVQVEATNNFIKTKYIGELPIYND